MEETQSVDIHDVLNAQGFAMHYRAISNTGSHLSFREREVYFLEYSNTAIQVAIKESWVCSLLYLFEYIVSLNSQVMFFFL